MATLSIAVAGLGGGAPASEAALPQRVAAPRADLGLRIADMPGRRVPAPSPKQGTHVARILIESTVRASPGGRPVGRVSTRTRWTGSSQRLMVLRSAVSQGRQWLLVRLPDRPNSARGWIPRDRVELSRSPWFIQVDRSARRVTVRREGRVKARFRIVVGAPATPTPTGLFALHDRVRQPDPHGFIGPWAVHLTAHSNVLRRYDGGPGRIAFHGRDGASLLDPLGSARSHGCMRMANARIAWIAGMPMGTAVEVVP